MKYILLPALMLFAPALAEENTKFEKCLRKNILSQENPKDFCINQYRTKAQQHELLSKQHEITRQKYLAAIKPTNDNAQEKPANILVDNYLLPKEHLKNFKYMFDVFRDMQTYKSIGNLPEEEVLLFNTAEHLFASIEFFRTPLKKAISENMSKEETEQIIAYSQQQIDFWGSDIGRKITALTPQVASELAEEFATSKEGLALFEFASKVNALKKKF